MNVISSEPDDNKTALLLHGIQEFSYIQEGTVFDVSEYSLYVLQEGELSLEMTEFGYDAPSHVIMLRPGDPVGMLPKYITGFSFCYRATENSVVLKLTSKFREETPPFIITLLNALSSSVFRVLTERPDKNGPVTPKIVSEYPVIRELIYQYMYMKKNRTLKEDMLLAFILERAPVSRDDVTAVLSGLVDGAYLDIRDGKLNAINMTLPEECKCKASGQDIINGVYQIAC